MTSVEGSLWLREFLVRAGVPEQEAGKYSSHSLKSTLLSWSALHGSLSMDERRAMGHHFDGRLAIPLVYSRDFLVSNTCQAPEDVPTDPGRSLRPGGKSSATHSTRDCLGYPSGRSVIWE